MKVKNLIKKLAECNPNAEVIFASDMEGNSYSTYYGLSKLAFYANIIEKDAEFGDIEREIVLGDSPSEFESKDTFTKPKKCIVIYAT